MTGHRLAIVTPCFRESTATIEKMVESVLSQTQPCHHVVICDGIQRHFADGLYAQYVSRGHRLSVYRLPWRTNNSGAAPRALGAAWAFAQGAQVVSFLDADNALLSNHAEVILGTLTENATAIATQRRVFLKEDNSETPTEKTENIGQHVDTNCLSITRALSRYLPIWLLWPQQFGTGEDRIFSAILNASGEAIARTNTPTVLYWSEWPIHYQLAGRPVPATARRPKRRAATHFHAQSFFELVGEWPIAEHWRGVDSTPLPPITGEPLVAHVVSAAPASAQRLRIAEPPLLYVDLFVASSAHQTPVEYAQNRGWLQVPGHACLHHQLAHLAVLAFHAQRAAVLFFVNPDWSRSEQAYERVFKAVANIKGSGVVLITADQSDGPRLEAVAATTNLGGLWACMASDPESAEATGLEERISTFRDKLLAFCQACQVPVVERGLL